jgi:flagellar L-ring protein precursor FlgH
MKNILKFLLIIAISAFSNLSIADDVVNSTDINSLYTDHKAYKVGDIVTIIVVESTEGYQSASLKTSKQQSLSGGMGMSSWGGGVLSPFPYVPSWGAGAQEYQDGSGKSTRKGGLMAKISARVEKVLSNNNLVIKGTKVIEINDDKQNLIIEGVIRPEDIASDNTILSIYVADAKIRYEGKGPIGEKTSPGIITRILDWLGLF